MDFVSSKQCFAPTLFLRKEEKMKKLLSLFVSFLKIGAFTFGGGYAMIALLENEFVSKKKWLEKDEFLDMVAIAESTPGPVAINSATYIGYKIGKVWGAIVSTVAVVLPSFVIIYLVSLFLDRFLSLKLVSCAFKGIQVCVVYLILSAGIKMLGSLKKNAFEIVLVAVVLTAMVVFSIFAVNFSTVLFILLCGTTGVAFSLISKISKKEEKSE